MQTNETAGMEGEAAPRLQAIVAAAVTRVLQRFAAAQLQPEQLGVSLAELTSGPRPRLGGHRSTEPFYPASIVKTFYAAAALRWLAAGRLAETPELLRALRDMIAASLNEATGYVVDLLTDTTSGPELAPREFEVWREKRNAINRYFAAQGYHGINLNRKTWCEGPYGREQQLALLPPPDDRNWLTTAATTRLFVEMAGGRIVSPERSRQLLAWHERQPFAPDAEVQSREYIGAAVPPGARLWSKAGWTSAVRHDAAYVELANGAKCVLVIFTTGHSREKEIIPSLAREIFQRWPDA